MKSTNVILLLTTLFFGVACQNDEDKGRIVIRLTDSPGDYDKVNVDIQDIQVNDNNGWKSLPNVNKGIYNLLDLTDGRETVLTSAEYSGKINQIRLILGEDNSVEIDGYSHPMETPSAQQSGLKLLLSIPACNPTDK